MKKISVIILLSLIALNINAQTKVNQQGSMLTIPKGAVKLKDVQDKEKLASKFQINGDVGKLSDASNDYVVDGMYLSLFYHRKSYQPDYLLTLKTDLEKRRNRLGLKDSYFTSSVLKDKEKEVLIVRNHGPEWNYYSFDIVNTEYSASVHGILKFSGGEETNAKQKIEEIIESVQFQR